jgi:hypothetical protein
LPGKPGSVLDENSSNHTFPKWHAV